MKLILWRRWHFVSKLIAIKWIWSVIKTERIANAIAHKVRKKYAAHEYSDAICELNQPKVLSQGDCCYFFVCHLSVSNFLFFSPQPLPCYCRIGISRSGHLFFFIYAVHSMKYNEFSCCSTVTKSHVLKYTRLWHRAPKA